MNLQAKQTRSLVRLWMIALCATLLAACATTDQKPSPEQHVQERAQARWDALLDDRIEEAYGYFAPGYRTGLSLADYHRRLAGRRILYTGAAVTGSTCSETNCKVQITVDFAVMSALPGVPRMDSTSPVEEDWVFTTGDWYLLPEN